jgi:hypothetical protein
LSGIVLTHQSVLDQVHNLQRDIERLKYEKYLLAVPSAREICERLEAERDAQEEVVAKHGEGKDIGIADDPEDRKDWHNFLKSIGVKP